MKRFSKPEARWLAGALAVVVALACAAPPATAAEATAPTPTSGTSPAEPATIAAMADAKVQATDPAEAAAPAPSQEMTPGKPFLKSSKGIAAAVLLVAGTVLVAYSRSNDRPTSPVR